jgi:hypothetical protein
MWIHGACKPPTARYIHMWIHGACKPPTARYIHMWIHGTSLSDRAVHHTTVDSLGPKGARYSTNLFSLMPTRDVLPVLGLNGSCTIYVCDVCPNGTFSPYANQGCTLYLLGLNGSCRICMYVCDVCRNVSQTLQLCNPPHLKKNYVYRTGLDTGYM